LASSIEIRQLHFLKRKFETIFHCSLAFFVSFYCNEKKKEILMFFLIIQTTNSQSYIIFATMLSFDNTEIAFASKSNKELNRAYKLFKMVGKPGWVKFGRWATDVAFKLRLPVKGMIKKTIFKQFCGGETIQECDDAIDQLGKYNVGTILDYSVEGQTSSEAFDETCHEIIETIKRSASDDRIPFAVFKITGISRFDFLEKVNDQSSDLTDQEKTELFDLTRRVNQICKAAHDANTPVFIDAEDSWIQDGIDRFANSMMARYNKERAIVYNTIQMYRHDRLDFLKQSMQHAQQHGYHLGIKLVRGAYMEKERERALEMGYASPIQPDKESSDRDYDLAVQFMLDNIDSCAICAGTHNENSSKAFAEAIDKKGIDKSDSRLYFAQLFGMSDHISFNLASNGYNVAKYVPYGPLKEVMPYLIRRAEENTSVAGQTSRELGLILKERKRRKL
jgi:proline dehydrogenase